MNPALQHLNACFPQSADYRNGSGSFAVHESTPGFRHFPYRERHIQCLWANPRNRPTQLKTSEDENVEVEHPGDWNLEAGPDFLNAVLLVGKEKRRIAGDLEIHIHPNAWKQHGHNTDTRYENVRFHIVYFQGSEIPGLIQIPLQEILSSDPKFSFDNIDLTAFPYSIPSGDFPMLGIDPDQKIRFLKAAGEERLRLKAERLALAMQSKDPDQILWEELMASLGYKNNKTAFRQLAALIPAARLCSLAKTPEQAYALLLGLSGLLPKNLDPKWPPETKTFIRNVWDFWWKQSEEIKDLALKKSDWILSGIRPANHPVRRLMAAAHYAFHILPLEGDASSEPSRLSTGSDRASPSNNDWLIGFPDNFWNTHISWKTKCEPTALVGKSRSNAIITNILIPFRAASGKQIDLSRLPPEPSNSIIRQTAFILFGPDHTPKVYKSALARQGLIQIFHDYLITHRLDELKAKFGGTTSSLSVPENGGTTSPLSAPENGGTLSPMSTDDEDIVPPEFPDRKHPAHHPPIERFNHTPILFLTVCTYNRKAILSDQRVHEGLLKAWHKANEWIIGDYVIMPDHIHLFCSPAKNDSAKVARWVSYWKRTASQLFPELQPMWQRDCWDTQLRNHESYTEKWNYVQNNPVRAGLVESVAEWPYKGTINHLPW